MQPQERLIENAGIGASEAAIILGLSKYKTPTQLYFEKRGEMVPDDISDREWVHFGNVLEDTVASEYARRTGETVHRVNIRKTHRVHNWMQAQIDRRIVGKKKHLECKTTNVFYYASDEWGPSGTDQVPYDYLCQGQHQLAVLDNEEMDLAVLVGGQRFAIYPIKRDEALIEMIVEAEATFYECVMTGVQPELQYDHPAALDFLKRRYPGTNGLACDLPEYAYDLTVEYQTLGKEIKAAETRQKEIKAELLALCGEHAVGLLPGDAGGWTRKLIDATEVAYTRAAYIDFRYSKKPKVS